MRATTAFLMLATTALAEDDVAVALQNRFADVAKAVSPSVVCVTTYVRADEATDKRGWQEGDTERYPGFRPLASASGIVLDDGHVLTCRHALVRKDGSLARVVSVETAARRHVLSRVVATEPTLNLAVLRFAVFPKGKPPRAPAAKLDDEATMEVGHWAIALGDPFGPAKTFAVGNLSAQPQRQCYQGQITATYLQASLRVHPEAYGGPLVNIRGEIVGMMVPRLGPDGRPLDAGGLEFALPNEILNGIFAALKVTKATETSPWLGFSVLELAAVRARLRRTNPEALRKLKAPLTGVYVDDVFDPSPASRAGIKPGDYLVSFAGHKLLTVVDFQKALYLSGPGRRVALELFRDGAARTIEVTVAARPADARPR